MRNSDLTESKRKESGMVRGKHGAASRSEQRIVKKTERGSEEYDERSVVAANTDKVRRQIDQFVMLNNRGAVNRNLKLDLI